MHHKKLYVISVISNPRRFKSRYALYKNFAEYVERSGAHLITVEMAHGDRPHEVTLADHPDHVQLRTEHELWSKENMINIGLSRLPKDWEYVAWIDADIEFVRPDWVVETIHMLQHHHVIQMFSESQDLTPNYEPFSFKHTSFAHKYVQKGFSKNESGEGYHQDKNGHPGYAWAANREAMDILGGVFDQAILGAGDRHMAYALVGQAAHSFPAGMSQGYKDSLLRWQKRASKLNRDIGCMRGLLNHYWHGKKKDRRYSDRWKILVDHGFCPANDIYKDSQGVWCLNDDRIELRDDIRAYFTGRSEDSIDID